MTCHLTFTKLSDRSRPVGANSTVSGPAADTRGNIIQLPRRSTSSPPPTGRTRPFFIPSASRPSDHRELAALLFLFVVFGLPLIFFGSLYLLFVP